MWLAKLHLWVIIIIIILVSLFIFEMSTLLSYCYDAVSLFSFPIVPFCAGSFLQIPGCILDTQDLINADQPRNTNQSGLDRVLFVYIKWE